MTASLRATAAILALGLAMSGAGLPASATPASATNVTGPLKGLSFDVGAKHAVGYYEAIDGACNLTLLVGDADDRSADFNRGTVPVRFKSTIPAGRTARIDTGEGPSLEFVCAPGAASLMSRVIERLAYVPAAK